MDLESIIVQPAVYCTRLVMIYTLFDFEVRKDRDPHLAGDSRMELAIDSQSCNTFDFGSSSILTDLYISESTSNDRRCTEARCRTRKFLW